MNELTVGRSYVPGVTTWPEIPELFLDTNGYSLVVRLNGIRMKEAEAFMYRPCRFGWATISEGISFFLCEFPGCLKWSDMPFQWWRIPADRRVDPSARDTDQTRIVLQCILVDAGDGIVKALRVVSLSPKLSRAIASDIRYQAATPEPDWQRYDHAIAHVLQRHTSEDLVKKSIVISSGGA